MDFGKILEEWEREKNPHDRKKQGRQTGGHQPSDGFGALLDEYGHVDKDAVIDRLKPQVPGEGRQKLKRMKSERTLDLHGCTVAEGLKQLEYFLLKARHDKLKKVLIIHGKGKHSPQGPVLRTAVRDFLRESGLVGETGKAKKGDGGDGATWAVIRYRSR
ncbi:MAG: Smr/MutS family protein [Spirochaetales bacterium]|nr:Smr/MutS family protein [Spirochaetales bacterium]